MARCVETPRQTVRVHYSDPASTREYAISECPTRDEAVLVAAAYSPAIDIVNNIARFRDVIDIKEHGGGCWNATVRYVRNPNSVEMNFDIGAGSEKAYQSKETVAGYDCVNPFGEGGNGAIMGEDFPDFGMGIGYNGTHFDGVQVELPKMEFSLNQKLKFTTLSGEYIQNLFEMAQTVNDADYTFNWKGQILTFVRGTLRFRGARIKQDSDDNVDITYSFVYSRGLYVEDDVHIGDSDPIEKEGHQYIWVYYQEVTDAGRKVKKPISAYVERVYEYADFSQLLIG